MKYKINDNVEFMYDHRKRYGHGYIKRAEKGLFGVTYYIVQVKTLEMRKIKERNIIGVLAPTEMTYKKKTK